ncbi:MAG: aminoglycoside phosphotransferase [Rhodospirillaceae bacterium]|nr:aminoglycoside phosphotransferase [Rhodospirillaceae bacterium]|tara:strand:+ start:2471 stop:3499 length:1029 start_codon:yes stop_codon:yes gene_type:complete
MSEDMDFEILLAHLQRLVEQSMPLWDQPEGTRATLMNVSENATYRLDAPDGSKTVLRVHRENYHSYNGIQTELDWLHALQNDAGIITPQAITGRDGKEIQEGIVDGLPVPRQMVLFEFIDGVEPSEDDDLIEPFRKLGEVSALLHLHAIDWQRPAYFKRLVWDHEHVVGPNPNWGNWRDGPIHEPAHIAQFEQLEKGMVERLNRYGRGPERFGLAHADLRLANLLLVGDSTRVIDFDDCGDAWFLYDLATALTLIDNIEATRALVESWLDGYARHRELDGDDLTAIASLIMMRRIAMMAWFGTHADTTLAQDHRGPFPAETCEMIEAYLSSEPSADNIIPWA